MRTKSFVYVIICYAQFDISVYWAWCVSNFRER